MSKYIAGPFDERFAIDPEIIYALCRAGFSDTSNGDDICPSFSRLLFNDPIPELDIELKPIGRLQLFVDAENVEHREFTDTHRFQVHHYNLDGVLFFYQGFDSLDDALKFLKKVLV